MSRAEEVISLFDGLAAQSPAGYAIGLHLSFTTSKYIFQTYDRTWMEEYSRKGLILNDPTIRWGLENEGNISWSELSGSDPAGVIESAKKFGLTFGVSISVVSEGARSLGSFASNSTEFDEETVSNLTSRLEKMHRLASEIETDSADDKQIKRFAASLSGIELHDL